MVRLAVLERLRDRAERIAEKLCNLIGGNLTDEERAPFARIADPVLAFTRAATAIRRIVALEERIDEDADERAARLADEAAKRAAAETARLPADSKIHLRANRRIAHDAIHAAIDARNCKMNDFQHGSLLADLVADLDLPDYADLDLIIAQIGKELDAIIGPPDMAAETADDVTPPRLPKPPPAAQLTDVYAAVQRATEAIRLMQAGTDSG